MLADVAHKLVQCSAWFAASQPHNHHTTFLTHVWHGSTNCTTQPTVLQQVNEADGPMLLAGSADGAVRVWRSYTLPGGCCVEASEPSSYIAFRVLVQGVATPEASSQTSQTQPQPYPSTPDTTLHRLPLRSQARSGLPQRCRRPPSTCRQPRDGQLRLHGPAAALTCMQRGAATRT